MSVKTVFDSHTIGIIQSVTVVANVVLFASVVDNKVEAQQDIEATQEPKYNCQQTIAPTDLIALIVESIGVFYLENGVRSIFIYIPKSILLFSQSWFFLL